MGCLLRRAETLTSITGTEYWHLDPSGPGKTFVCNAAGPYQEDPTGSSRVPTTGINPDHLVYFVIPYITPFYI